MASGSMISDPKTGDLLVLGGSTDENAAILKSVYRLNSTNSQWKLDQTKEMFDERKQFVSFFVPDEKVICEDMEVINLPLQ